MSTIVFILKSLFQEKFFEPVYKFDLIIQETLVCSTHNLCLWSSVFRNGDKHFSLANSTIKLWVMQTQNLALEKQTNVTISL